jgi:hypothetical protein
MKFKKIFFVLFAIFYFLLLELLLFFYEKKYPYRFDSDYSVSCVEKSNNSVIYYSYKKNCHYTFYDQFNISSQNKKISFIHMDADLYSSTKYIFDIVKDYMDKDCIIVFDELVNYPGFDGDNGELKAFYEFITENKVDYEWIGMNGTPTDMSGYYHENVALIIHSIN